MSPPKSTDPTLAGPQADAQIGLEAVYRAHGPWLLGFLRRRFGREAAEDLAQETFLRAARGAQPIHSPKAFLATTALNAARDQARRRAARPRLVSDDGVLATARLPEDQAEALLLKEVIMGLPHNLRDVFLLSRFGGLSYAEIAQQCGISVRTVEWRMSKALRLCAARIRS